MIVPVFAIAIAVAALPTVSFGRNSTKFTAVATGYHEVPLSINTDGFAVARFTLDDDAKTLSFRYEFSGLTSNLVQSHIHLGEVQNAGGVMIFLCGPNVPPATQNCPSATSGTVSGTLTAANVLAIANQNVVAGDMAALFRAIRSKAAYANLHSVNFPGGEIRGQLED
jgi:hypothetical protein